MLAERAKLTRHCDFSGFLELRRDGICLRRRIFTEILIRQGILSPEQIAEAKKLSKSSNKKLPDAILTLGYASGEEVMRALAQAEGLDYIDLREVVIPPSVVELVPESVARENAILPMAEEDGATA